MKKPEKKSILSECAYQGGGIPKKYIAERSNFINGYNQCWDVFEKFLPSEGEIENIIHDIILNIIPDKKPIGLTDFFNCTKAIAKAISKRIGKI